MSELKVASCFEFEKVLRGKSNKLFYSKDEADKVIAELEEKLAAAQLVLRLNKPEALYSNLDTMNRLSHEIDVVARRERHQKYKRCLAMAKYCDMGLTCYNEKLDSYSCERAEFFYKWLNRWWKLAEKFKPNKEAK